MTTERLTLKSERLTLEPYRVAFAQPAWEAVRLSKPELLPWMPWARNSSLEATRAFCERTIAEWDSGTAYEFAVFHEDSLVGAGGLHGVVPLIAKAEVGYWIRSDRAGEGLMTEAAAMLRDFAFDTLGIRRLELRAGTENMASRRVAEKIGFLEEGTLRGGGVGDAGPYDTTLYGMLNTDPRP